MAPHPTNTPTRVATLSRFPAASFPLWPSRSRPCRLLRLHHAFLVPAAGKPSRTPEPPIPHTFTPAVHHVPPPTHCRSLCHCHSRGGIPHVRDRCWGCGQVLGAQLARPTGDRKLLHKFGQTSKRDRCCKEQARSVDGQSTKLMRVSGAIDRILE
jgi:hypothetical protein